MLVKNIDSLSKLIHSRSPSQIEAFQESLFTTKQSNAIKAIKLDEPIEGLVTFRSNTTLITKEDVSRELSDSSPQSNVQFVKI